MSKGREQGASGGFHNPVGTVFEGPEIDSLLVKVPDENSFATGYMLASEIVAIILAFSLIERYNSNDGYAQLHLYNLSTALSLTEELFPCGARPCVNDEPSLITLSSSLS